MGFGAFGRWGFSLAVPATAARAALAKGLGPFRNWSRGPNLGLIGVLPTSAVRVLWAAPPALSASWAPVPFPLRPRAPPSPCSSSRPRARGLVVLCCGPHGGRFSRARALGGSSPAPSFARLCPRPRPSRPRACLLPTARHRRSLVAPTRLPACSETKRAPLRPADRVFDPFSDNLIKSVNNH